MSDIHIDKVFAPWRLSEKNIELFLRAVRAASGGSMPVAARGSAHGKLQN